MENVFQGLSNSLDLNNQSVAVDVVRVRVELSPNEMFTDVAKAYSNEVLRITRFESKKTTISAESMEKFFNTVLYLHVCNVNSMVKPEYRNIIKRVNLPTVLVSILLNIGEATDKDYGLKFVPSMDIDSEQLMSPSEIEDFSQELLRLENLGLKITTTGLPLPNKCGTIGFMGSQLVEHTDVRSYRHDHPVMGFFRSMFRSQSLEQVIGLSALRVRYGYYDHYASLVRVFVNESERN